ncbi:peptidoglycan DD-metalloendopeptidase family protein [Iocasia frigidifontis]|uniref:Peptidoglycan DD-metalloendopeptidase family protein n=1 Tax=Iocasia fonsfrigidae TaxID=2682810 RepID=A0A8A7KP70_9FIRM|nr:M23 family metallopeptidase [Iocasia fonsfrigidae]QTL99602.1 peptidoglycan DD-metalloendopeptidase family protein [Iocasia fonsfrigidae]
MKKLIITVFIISLLLLLPDYSLISGYDNEAKRLPVQDIQIDDAVEVDKLFDTDIVQTNDEEQDVEGEQLELTEKIDLIKEEKNLLTSVGDAETPEALDSLRTDTNGQEMTDVLKPSNIREDEVKLTLFDRVEEYRVKKGDNLWEIANSYRIDIDTLIGANDINNMNRIQVGDVLVILPVKGILYKINPGENLWTITRDFAVSLDEVIEANGISNPDLVKPGKVVLLPGAKPEFGYQERLSQHFIKPIDARISSYFGMRWGRMHEGIDFAVNTGTRIRAARSGKIIYGGWASGYGNTVIIEHERGVRSLYAHNSKLLVSSGQRVERGQAIALSGNTGNSTGPHLHFEIQINGQPVNPLNYIKM